jgi:hypothetical protein
LETMAVCLAILHSSREGREMTLHDAAGA